MSEIIVCRTCGTVVELAAPPGASAAVSPASPSGPGLKPVTLHVDERTARDLEPRRLLLMVCYVLAGAGLAAFYVFGLSLNDKSTIFFWPIDEFGRSLMGQMDDKSLVAVFFPVMLVVGGAFVAVRLRALVLGIVVGAAALAAYYGFLQVRKDVAWADIGWLDSSLVAALLAIFLGLLFSRRWLVLVLFIPVMIGLGFGCHYLNRDLNQAFTTEWLPLFAGILHGLVIGVAARLAGWILNRRGAGVLLGAFVGGFLGLLLADDVRVRELLQMPDFRALKAPLVSLYSVR